LCEVRFAAVVANSIEGLSLGRKKVLVIGGGIAGLSAAFELTRTAELRAKHDVRLYQVGWRLGGKCASGRDDDGRNVEHGLHIWFGYYENAFRLLRDVYEVWNYPGGQKITRAGDAVQPQSFTPIGNGEGNTPSFHEVSFLTNADSPGTGTANLGVWKSLVQILQLFVHFYEQTVQLDPGLINLEPRLRIEPERDAVLVSRMGAAVAPSPQNELSVGQFVRAVTEWSEHIEDDHVWSQYDQVHKIAGALRRSARATLGSEFALTSAGGLLAQTLDIVAAFANGLVTDFLFGERSIEDLDRLDFRRWLLLHGAMQNSVIESPALFALYDTMFQYPEGERGRASYGAGTAVQVVLRMLGTYQGALAWELQAGMGDVLVAPLYEVLKDRGVKFRFFHKLTKIDISDERTSIESLHFDRQVDLTVDQDCYKPVKVRCGSLSWGAEPDWSVIKDGKDLKAAGIDLESYWCSQKVESIVLKRGHDQDFDEAVLAIPLGAFKELNAVEGPCSQLFKANHRFRAMAEALPLVPSISVQVWSKRTLQDLGWTAPKPAMVCAPQPLDVWADMSQLLAYERSPESKSLHYLCNVLATQLYRCPPTDHGVPAQAKKLAHELAVRWFEEKAPTLWRKAVTRRGGFDWDVLCAPSTKKGQDRLSGQIVKANVNPSDCCVATAANTTAFRLKTDESGFEHLYLCGSWIKSGLNTECIEAAVMSGMQAARAISGEDRPVPGENFLHMKQSTSLCDLFRATASLLLNSVSS
jgi:uncharacterized protein with NAD-binding domain and iron-sulfur cluster